jgi:hypothetical protein
VQVRERELKFSAVSVVRDRGKDTELEILRFSEHSKRYRFVHRTFLESCGGGEAEVEGARLTRNFDTQLTCKTAKV